MWLHLYHFYILRTVAAGTGLSDNCAGEISLQESHGLESHCVSHTQLAIRKIASMNNPLFSTIFSPDLTGYTQMTTQGKNDTLLLLKTPSLRVKWMVLRVPIQDLGSDMYQEEEL